MATAALIAIGCQQYRICDSGNCPVITTFKGKGLISDDQPLACGVLGRSGTLIASHLMNASDVLLVFGQYMGELCTAVKYGMNIKHILLNNRELGEISQEQRAIRMPVWETSLHNPDFARYAEKCGAMGFQVTETDELDQVLETVFAEPGPCLVEVSTDPELT